MDPTEASGYETTDARPRPILIVGFALFALFVGGLAAAALVTDVFVTRAEQARAAPSPLFERRLPEQAPLLVDEPGYARAALAKPKRHLERYGWIDRTQSTVHIPIDRAMHLYLTRTATRTGTTP